MREIAEALFIEHNVVYEAHEVRKALAAKGYTSKVISVMAREQNEELRKVWREHITENPDVVAAEFVFVDETHICHADCQRRKGWSRSYERAWVSRSMRKDDPTASSIAALSLHGVISSTEAELVDGDFFLHALETDILPHMGLPNADPTNVEILPLSTLVIDNAATHLKAAIVALCVACDVRVLFLPPYSFDLNPIEKVFHIAKHYIRVKWGTTSADFPMAFQLHEALMNCIKSEVACNLFENAGFTVSNAERQWAAQWDY
jgi:hypothetical protein